MQHINASLTVRQLPNVCLACYEQAFLCLQPVAGLLPLNWGGLSWGTGSSGVAAAGFQSTGFVAVRCGLSCFGALWDLPGPGFEPMPSALAGRLLSIGPPGKSLMKPLYKTYALHSQAIGFDA